MFAKLTATARRRRRSAAAGWETTRLQRGDDVGKLDGLHDHPDALPFATMGLRRLQQQADKAELLDDAEVPLFIEMLKARRAALIQNGMDAEEAKATALEEVNTELRYPEAGINDADDGDGDGDEAAAPRGRPAPLTSPSSTSPQAALRMCLSWCRPSCEPPAARPGRRSRRRRRRDGVARPSSWARQLHALRA